jgi:hypothetical protein
MQQVQQCIAIDHERPLHAEVPLLAFRRLLRLGLSFVAAALIRTRRTDDRRIDDRVAAPGVCTLREGLRPAGRPAAPLKPHR